jgi:glucose/arabinose dehydrogenase
MNPCALPGSVVFTSNGTTIVPGGSPSWPSLSFLHLPPGFCAHYYGTVGNARQLRFAPGGELFVSSPTMVSTGGGPNGESAFIILPDDNQDGVGDAPVTFLSFASSGAMNQGMLFAPGYFYYQDGVTGTQILRMPYVTGQRAPSAAGEMVANINVYTSALHWPKTMDMADDGSIYVGNGGDQGESCDLSRPFHGGILKLDPAPGGPNPGGQQIAKGLRNPIAVRCRPGKDTCFALELALDYSSGQGGREKLLPIHQGDDWGFPCCATQNLAYQTGNNPATNADCATTAAEGNSFLIGDTPFGVDFEGGHWPAPYTDNAFVVTHGAAGSWTGARLVAIPVDPSTGLPTPSTDADGGKNVGMTDFGTGWDDGTLTHGRPAAVAFHPDGRLFVANDNNGVIFWIGSTN